MKTRPMIANWTRSSGLQLALAPTSRRRVRPLRVGTSSDRAGLLTPLERPEDLAADVDDGGRVAHADEGVGGCSLTSWAPIRIEERPLGGAWEKMRSPMPMCSGASMNVTRGRDGSSRSNSRRTWDSTPTRRTSRSKSRDAWSAPWTAFRGPKSPPIASMAIFKPAPVQLSVALMTCRLR